MEAAWFVDATETGELLPLAGAEHVTGAESRERDRRAARRRASPTRSNMQPVTPASRSTTSTARTTRSRARPATTPARYSLLAPDPRTNALVPRTLTPNPPGDPALIGPDLADPVARQGAVAVPADRGARELRARPPAQRHHARQLAADRLHGRPGVRRAGRRPPSPRRARAEPGLPALAADRGGLPGAAAARRRRRLHPDGLAKALYIRESRRIRGEHDGRSSRSSAARTRTASGSASTGSTCTPRPAGGPTSTSPARRSRSRSAR